MSQCCPEDRSSWRDGRICRTRSWSPGGAPVATTSAGSGTQTVVNAPCGDGNGTTTFNVCDLRGDFVRNWDDGRGIDANRPFGLEQMDAMQGHFHTSTVTGGNGVLIGNGAGIYGATANNWSTSNVGVSVTGPTTDGVNGTPRTATETRPRNYSLMPIIRYQ